MVEFNRLFEAMDPDEVFKPASEEELEDREYEESKEVYQVETDPGHIFQLVYSADSDKTEFVVKSEEFGDFVLATFQRGKATVPDGMALLDALHTMMTEYGEDVTGM